LPWRRRPGQLCTVGKPCRPAFRRHRGARFLFLIIERFPIVVWGGGALLGWIAGGLLPEDPIIAEHFSEATAETLEIVCGIAGAIIVVLVGMYLVKSRRMREEAA
jgi:predicted tellurium resistance membrane protein TerC